MLRFAAHRASSRTICALRGRSACEALPAPPWLCRFRSASPERRMQRFGRLRPSSCTDMYTPVSEASRSLAYDALTVQFAKVAASPATHMLRFASAAHPHAHKSALRGREGAKALPAPRWPCDGRHNGE